VGTHLVVTEPRARGEVRVETAEYAAHAFRGVDSNRIAVMLVCADRDACEAVIEEERKADPECRCERVCSPPGELASKPMPADPERSTGAKP
jgi:hypothetical protein